MLKKLTQQKRNSKEWHKVRDEIKKRGFGEIFISVKRSFFVIQVPKHTHIYFNDFEVSDYNYHSDQALDQRVSMLIEDVSDATCFLSYPVYDHPVLLKIINIGKVAIPYLAKYLKVGADCSWYATIALKEITGENPVKEEHRGNLKGIIKDWKEWLDCNRELSQI